MQQQEAWGGMIVLRRRWVTWELRHGTRMRWTSARCHWIVGYIFGISISRILPFYTCSLLGRMGVIFWKASGRTGRIFKTCIMVILKNRRRDWKVATMALFLRSFSGRTDRRRRQGLIDSLKAQDLNAILSKDRRPNDDTTEYRWTGGKSFVREMDDNNIKSGNNVNITASGEQRQLVSHNQSNY